MKRGVFLTWVVLISLSTFGQRANDYYVWPVNPATNKIEFTELSYAPGNKQDLYNRAKAFIVRNLNDERDSIIAADEKNLLLTATGSYVTNLTQLGEKGKGFVSYLVTIKCNDNSYKYTFSNFEHSPLQTNGAKGGALERSYPETMGYSFPNRLWYQLKANCFYQIQTTIERLKEAMDKKS